MLRVNAGWPAWFSVVVGDAIHGSVNLRSNSFEKLKKMNIVKVLKIFEDIFTDRELSRLNDFVDKLRLQGQNEELLGETYILFNKQVKRSKREQVQQGVSMFGHLKNETASEEHKRKLNKYIL